MIWEPGWYHTWQFWPLNVDEHIFECRQFFVPPKNASERLAQEMATITTREYAAQDANTLEATHSMLKAGVKTHFPLSDQELALRNLHHHVNLWVNGEHRPGRTSLWEKFQTALPHMPADAPAEGGISDPAGLRRHLRTFHEAGVDQVAFVQQAGRTRHEHICEAIELFATEVIPPPG